MLVSLRLVALLLAALATAPVFCSAQTEQPTRSAEAAKALKNDPLHVFSESVQALSAEVTKSVVQVLTSGFALSSDKQKTDTAYLAPEHGIGSGVILSPDGFIVTNAHVVQGARRIRVRLQGLEKKSTPSAQRLGPIDAKVVGVDRQTDLAVLKIDMTGLPALMISVSGGLIVTRAGSDARSPASVSSPPQVPRAPPRPERRSASAGARKR
jgi:serine protease Do